MRLSKEGKFQINLLINDKEIKEQDYFKSSKQFYLDKKIWKIYVMIIMYVDYHLL